MAKKKKGTRPPSPTRNDSMRADIEAARQANIDAVEGTADPFGSPEDGLDLVDDLLATLDARDAHAEQVAQAKAAEKAPSPQQRGLKVPQNTSQQQRKGSASSNSSSSGALSHLKEAGGRLLGKSPQSSSGDVASAESSGHNGLSGIRRLLGSPKNDEALPAGEQQQGGKGASKGNRAKARLARRDAEVAALRAQAEAELKANGGKPDEAERERKGIEELCKALKVEMHEINPDGHCLYSAVADQLNQIGKLRKNVDFRDTRKATAEHMRANAEDFMPFISDSDEHMAGIENVDAGTNGEGVEKSMQKHFLDYCDAVENTGVWGGQPEILALSRAYKTQIHVVQVGSPILKVGEGEQKGEPVVISYHRRMYGLGEHYNSLRIASKK